MLKKLFAVLLSTLSLPALAESVAEIKMDDEHLQMQRADGKSPQMYVISSGDALELDASVYQLVIPVHPWNVHRVKKQTQYNLCLEGTNSIHQPGRLAYLSIC